jgi:uncharacterized Ntn-hydrolase superfamily protein
MTFAVLATDESGAVGMAVTSSSPAVAARCIHLRPGVGGAASQNVTDPRLGPALLDALEAGQDPADAMSEVVAAAEHSGYRQLMVSDLHGGTAAFSGEGTLGVHASAQGARVVSAGNLLADEGVPAAVVSAFEAADGDLEQRLMTALEAGLAAGGEAGPVHSAGLCVARRVPWHETDLRVDWHDDDPVGELRRLVDRWLPERDAYVTRALDPSGAPTYGVPGDE